MTLTKTAKLKRFRLLPLFILLPLLMLCMQACSISDTGTTAYNQKDTYPIAPVLKDFYNALDGRNLIGAGLSPLLEIEGDQCQYATNALLCHNPKATGVARFYLMPLGLEMDIREDPVYSDPQENTIIVDGYVIYPEILPLYQQFYGRLYAGRPLTNAFYNPTTHQIEQYFENVGFYYNSESPGSKSGLIAYGQEICRVRCPENLLAIPPRSLPRSNPLTDMIVAVDFLGGESVFGQRLNELSVAPDGSLEIVYENAVFYAPMNNPRQIQLRELPERLGIEGMAPGPEVYGAEDNMRFYATEEDLGYHIPVVFDRFLQSHGGMQLSGDPLSDPMVYQDSLLPRQCYRHFCLEYDKDAEEGAQVSMVDLGRQYLQTGVELRPYSHLGGLGAALQSDDPPITYLSFVISEKSPQISRKETQFIEIFVFDMKTYRPAARVNAALIVSSPDGSQVEYTLPPTNKNGVSTVEIKPMADAKNGSLISYSVCLVDVQETCKSDAYIVWGE